jgi:hypothetical protein
MTYDEFVDKLEDVTTASGGVKARCPAHDDKVASLSVSEGEDGKLLVFCHASCDVADVVEALGLTIRDICGGEPPVRKEVARYVYRDGGGNPVFTKIRFKPKDFVIEGNAQALLYRLPEILAAPPVKTVLWVEGEKAADRLHEEGLLATTLGGAAKSPDKAVKVLRGRRVVILPDNDQPGRDHAETVSRCLKAAGVQSVRVLNLAGIPHKGDVCDWLDSGRTVEELQVFIRRLLGGGSATSIAVAAPEWAWEPRIPATGLTLVFGEAGIGKSTMVLDLVARWTRGDPMPESARTLFKPVTVGIYGCEDDLGSIVVPRLMAAGADLDRVFFLELDATRSILPGQVARMKQICAENDIKVLILDNIENGMGQIEENGSKGLRKALNPLADFGIPVIAIHHPKKGAMYGAATEAMSGSQAYTNVARTTMMVIPTDEEGLVAFALVKSNYVSVRDGRTLYFRIGSREVDGLNGTQPVISWEGGDYTSADLLMARLTARREKMRQEALKTIQSSSSSEPQWASAPPPPSGPHLRPCATQVTPSSSFLPPMGVLRDQMLPAESDVAQTPRRTISQATEPQEVAEPVLLDKLDKEAENNGIQINGSYVTTDSSVHYMGPKRDLPYRSDQQHSNKMDDWVLSQQQKHGYGQFKKEEE